MEGLVGYLGGTAGLGFLRRRRRMRSTNEEEEGRTTGSRFDSEERGGRSLSSLVGPGPGAAAINKSHLWLNTAQQSP
jgi:hypothetical protein